MNAKKLWIAAALSLGLSHSALALTEGQDYEVLPQSIPQLQKDKVEVLEFFGYFCPHCKNFDPILMDAKKKFASDTYLRTEHVVWDENRDLGLARLAAAVNQSEQKNANKYIYSAFQESKISLNNPDVARQWLAGQTLFNGKKVLAAYDSFSNQAQAQQMAKLTQQYQISGTPTVIVGGKYRVLMNTYEQGVDTINQLVDKVRGERGLKKPAAKAAIKSKGASIANSANQ